MIYIDQRIPECTSDYEACLSHATAEIKRGIEPARAGHRYAEPTISHPTERFSTAHTRSPSNGAEYAM